MPMGAEGRVREFLGNNPGFYFVNKEVFWDCYVRIKPYLDNSLLFPVLMRHNLARDLDDLQRLTEPSHQPHQRHLALLELADRGGEYGYMLLFMCIYEANQSPGHEDAAKILQETAKRMRIPPPYDRPNHRGSSLYSEGDLGVDHQSLAKSDGSATRTETPEEKIKKESEELQESFSQMVDDAYDIISDKKIGVESFAARLANLLPVQRELHGEFVDKVCDEITKETTVLKVWSKLTAYWNFLNYFLLEQVILKFGDPCLRAKMKDYKKTISHFQHNTRLRDFANCAATVSTNLSENLKLFAMKFEDQWDECTLEDLEKFEKRFTHQLLLPSFILTLKAIKPGCIHVTWTIPAVIGESLKEKMDNTEMKKFCKEHGITSITIDSEECKYSEEGCDDFTRSTSRGYQDNVVSKKHPMDEETYCKTPQKKPRMSSPSLSETTLHEALSSATGGEESRCLHETSSTISGAECRYSATIEKYSAFLRYFYLNKRKRTLTPFKLARMEKREVNRWKRDDFTRSTLRGDQDDVVYTKEHMDENDVGIPRNWNESKQPRFVLIEGAPGVGKTTFSEQFC